VSARRRADVGAAGRAHGPGPGAAHDAYLNRRCLFRPGGRSLRRPRARSAPGAAGARDRRVGAVHRRPRETRRLACGCRRRAGGSSPPPVLAGRGRRPDPRAAPSRTDHRRDQLRDPPARPCAADGARERGGVSLAPTEFRLLNALAGRSSCAGPRGVASGRRGVRRLAPSVHRPRPRQAARRDRGDGDRDDAGPGVALVGRSPAPGHATGVVDWTGVDHDQAKRPMLQRPEQQAVVGERADRDAPVRLAGGGELGRGPGASGDLAAGPDLTNVVRSGSDAARCAALARPRGG
jgi:hypothetical protein